MWNAKGKSTLFGVLFLSSLLVKARVHIVDVFLVQAILGKPQAFAKTINMKWILKRAANTLSNGILTSPQLFLRIYQSVIWGMIWKKKTDVLF